MILPRKSGPSGLTVLLTEYDEAEAEDHAYHDEVREADLAEHEGRDGGENYEENGADSDLDTVDHDGLVYDL